MREQAVAASPRQRLAGLNDARVRGALYQIVAVALVVLGAWYLFANASANLAQQNIATGFDYLWREASFVISDSLIDYQPSDTYARALLVGILNTIKVSLLACVLATLIGTAVGIARLSPNPLLARITLVYVESLRNTPLLLQLFFWYGLVILLPPVREAIQVLPGMFLSNGGLAVPRIAWSWAHTAVLLVLLASAVAALVAFRVATARQLRTGRDVPAGRIAAAMLLAPPLLALVLLRPDLSLDVPELGRFRLSGGLTLTPEFAALLAGLTFSTSATIAEIVRSGIQAVTRGQWEAALSLGLHRGLVMRLVILPQALRVIVPPLTSAYLNVTKNSSLAIAIGYPDLVSISNTTMNQTGQAMEAIAIFMSVYLSLSLLTSAFMNWYNRRVALVSR